MSALTGMTGDGYDEHDMTCCDRCLEQELHTPGTYRDHHGLVLCDDCDQNANEAAYERMLDDYYGGSGPQSIREQMADAYKVKREGC